MKTQTTIHEPFTKTVSFVDANRNKAVIKIELTHRNGYDDFSMSGDYAGSFGQCQDSIKPHTKAQKALLKLWDKWHLNGTHAGTEEQESLLESKEFKSFRGKADHYTAACEFLKTKGKYLVSHPETGEPYKYGHGWISRTLPEDITEQVDNIIEAIKAEESEREGQPIQCEDNDELIEYIEANTNFTGRDAELCAALVAIFGLCENDLQDVEINGTSVTVQGIEYLAGSDEEMEEAWDENLDNYIEECILPEMPEFSRNYFDNEAWKEDARVDGRAHSLNRYDGGEESTTINGTYYFAYRQ